MDGLPNYPESGHIPPAPTPPPGQAVIRRKLIGMIVGAFAGMPVGWLIGHYAYPWINDTYHVYHVAAGALAGAVIGGIFSGSSLGRLGWAVVLGTGGGALFGKMISPPKGDMALEGALIGFAVGFVAGLILELASVFARRENSLRARTR
jgi:hypothetical protein